VAGLRRLADPRAARPGDVHRLAAPQLPERLTPVPSTFLDLVTGEIGVPYVYGGDTPAGFDCSGLVQWAAGKMGVKLPRGATDQMHAIPHTTAPVAGDLVFFNTGDGWEAGHVGICANTGCSQMVDAPHTGALVRLEPVAGFGQIVAYGRLPDNAGQKDVDASAGGTLGISSPSDIAGSITDSLPDLNPLDAIAALPGELLKVFIGDHTIAELALRFVEIVGGALLLATGAVTFLVVIAHGGESGRAIQGARRGARTVGQPIARRSASAYGAATGAASARRQRPRNALEGSERRSGDLARRAPRAAPRGPL
jgi:hypothetical protein